MIETYRLPMGAVGGAYPKPPLSQNDRLHWSKTAKVKRDLRTLVVARLRSLNVAPGAHHVTVQLVYRPGVKRDRDSDNLAATTKVIADALQPTKAAYIDKNGKPHAAVLGYGLIAKDTDEHCKRPEAVFLPPDGKAREAWWIDLTVRR